MGAGVTIVCMSVFLLLIIYAFLSMRPQDRNGKDSSFNLAIALLLELIRGISKFLILALFAPITIFFIRRDFNEREE